MSRIIFGIIFALYSVSCGNPTETENIPYTSRNCVRLGTNRICEVVIPSGRKCVVLTDVSRGGISCEWGNSLSKEEK